MIFFLGDNLLDSTAAIQLCLSSNTLPKTSGLVRFISKIKCTFFINATKGITLRIACLNAIYSDSVLLRGIYVCNLMHRNTRYPIYVMTYPVCDMKFPSLSASA